MISIVQYNYTGSNCITKIIDIFWEKLLLKRYGFTYLFDLLWVPGSNIKLSRVRNQNKIIFETLRVKNMIGAF